MDRRSVLGLLGFGLIKCKEEDMQLCQQAIPMLSKVSQGFLGGVDHLEALGDSIGTGAYATVPLTTNGFYYQFKDQKGLSIQNESVGARGVWRQLQEFKDNGFTRSETLLAAMVGLNDMKRAGNNAKTKKKVEAGFKHYLVKHFAAGAYTPAGSASVTRSGTFSTFAAGLADGWIYPNGAAPGDYNSYTTSLNSYFEWTFTGRNVGFVFGALDGVVSSGWSTNIEVKIDGVVVDTLTSIGWYDGITDGAYNNAIGPVPWYRFGLSDGSHTIRVTSKDAAAATVTVDFFFQFGNPADLGSVVFLEIPYCTATGYASPGSNLGSESISDIFSLIISGIVDEFAAQGYRIRYFPTNDYLNLGTMMDVDGTHWNQLGHTTIATELINFTR
jgi:hypothetical protein